MGFVYNPFTDDIDFTGSGGSGGFQLPSLTSGSVLFSNGSTIVQDNVSLFWDAYPKCLYLGGNNYEGATLNVYPGSTMGTSSTTTAIQIYAATNNYGIIVDQGWNGIAGYFTQARTGGYAIKCRAGMGTGLYITRSSNQSPSGTDYLAYFEDPATNGSTDVVRINGLGTGDLLSCYNNTTLRVKIAVNGVFYPAQYPTASAPSYVKGGMYFDTTLNKLRIGGATAWETVTSV